MLSLAVRIEDLQTGRVQKTAFLRSPVRIGRSELNDLPLPQPFVSQWHAVIRFDEREVSYVDLGSTNGSLLDERRLERNVPVSVQPGVPVQIGFLRLSFEVRTTGEHRAVTQAPSTLFSMRAAALGPGPAPAPAPSSAPALDLGDAAPAPHLAPAAPAAPPLLDLGDAAGAPLLDLGDGVPAAPPPAFTDFPDAAGERAETALAEAALDLDLLYASYRGAWEHLRARVGELLVSLEPGTRAAAARKLADKYPALAQEATFRDDAGLAPPAAPAPLAPPRASPASPAPPRAAAGEAERLLETFAESYLPSSRSVRGAAEVQAFLGKVAEAIEAFGRSFVELRKGHEEFGKQMGVRTVHGDGPVQRARDPRQLLAALLDPGQEGRAAELQAAFADYMVHQVALLNGVVEGARSMLARLSPEAISAEAPQGMFSMKAQSMWRSYEERFHELFDEEGALSDALFGREFGKAYSAIAGRRGEPEPEEREPGGDRARGGRRER
jgi:predicted component of type VI protein secretion system